MSVKIKRGATLRVVLELTAEEWARVYPWQSIRAEAQNGAVEHELTVTVDDVARTITLTASTQPMALATYKYDVRMEYASGESVFLPADTVLDFQVIEGVTE